MYQINFQRIITRVVGGGYIALECAGILKGLCFDVTLMTRGKQLREFDQDIVEMILEHYQKYQKANIIPQSLTFHSEQKILFKWLSTVSSQKGSGIIDTLLMVIGNTKLLNLDELGVKVNHKKYSDYPTTIFTPIEYSFVGLNQKQAKAKFGEKTLKSIIRNFFNQQEQLCDKLDENYELLQKILYVKAVFCDNVEIFLFYHELISIINYFYKLAF